MIQEYLGIAMNQMNMINEKTKEWKEEILKEYAESINLPRKKKKQKRKELQLKWIIASYNPFDILN